jgi:hypothetical protein
MLKLPSGNYQGTKEETNQQKETKMTIIERRYPKIKQPILCKTPIKRGKND